MLRNHSMQQITRYFLVLSSVFALTVLIGCDDDDSATQANDPNGENDPTGEQSDEFFRASVNGIPFEPVTMTFGPSEITSGEFVLSGRSTIAHSLNFFINSQATGEYVFGPSTANLATYIDALNGISVAAMSGRVNLREAPTGYVQGDFNVTMEGNLSITGDFLVEKDE